MANPINDSPDRSYLKVDFGTILKRRKRKASDYLIVQNIKTIHQLEMHLRWLSKTYLVSDKFYNDCVNFVKKVEQDDLKSAQDRGDVIQHSMSVSKDDDNTVSLENEDSSESQEKTTKKPRKIRKPRKGSRSRSKTSKE